MTDPYYSTIVILAPPFHSHFRPLIALGTALRDGGAAVTIACTTGFREDVEQAGLGFVEVVINRNSNRGVATETAQQDSEADRLERLEATRNGPVDTLITQAHHRTADMFSNPVELIDRIREIDRTEEPSLWIVDQLSYGATLALHGLGLNYMTFCAPHPLSIPATGSVYSVPPSWPAQLQPNQIDLDRLESAARNVEKDFTGQFNVLLGSHFGKPGVPSAFGLTSPLAVVYNYPRFDEQAAHGTRRIFAGHSAAAQELSDDWLAKVSDDRPRLLLALGTFLSARDDVLTKLTHIIRSLRPEVQLFVGAGAGVGLFESYSDDEVIARRFIPQRALLDHVDIAVHHGGVSSFTESLHAGKPMIVMPFSSDQFNVARDVERYNLGSVIDPNALTEDTVAAALDHLDEQSVRSSIAEWSAKIRRRGPVFAAAEIQQTPVSAGKIERDT